ncbi:MAG: conjugal transfer protein TraV [Chromatiaceae bacterium]|nr:MAG: conjugal transfer protein TraV [Chromatiaceae bacterium]
MSGCAATTPREAGTTNQAVRRVVVGEATDQRPSELQPERLPATTMQAWIAPWEDATGDLYPASTVFIEVQPERWQYRGGEGIPTVLRPLQVEPRAAPQTTPLQPNLDATPAQFPLPDNPSTQPRWGA